MYQLTIVGYTRHEDKVTHAILRPYIPTNGEIETVKKTVKRMAHAMGLENLRRWDISIEPTSAEEEEEDDIYVS